MASFIKYATAAAAGYAWRAYSQRNNAYANSKASSASPLAGIITGYLVERIFDSLWPEKPKPQEYRKVPFSDHYVRYDQPQNGFYNLYRNFRKW
jgi:hypothetical protein